MDNNHCRCVHCGKAFLQSEVCWRKSEVYPYRGVDAYCAECNKKRSGRLKLKTTRRLYNNAHRTHYYY